MALYPNGKRRIMVAQQEAPQQFGPDFGETAGTSVPNPQETPPLDEVEQEAPPAEIRPEDVDESQTGSPETPVVEGGGMEAQKPAKDIQGYIFNKLQSFGYPPRRLEEFEDEFVEENLSPGDVRDVTVVIPARYYGKRETLSKEDFAKMINEIQKQFGLSFMNAKKTGKKISIQFSSQTVQDASQTQQPDELDEVYGTPKGNKGSGGSQRKAFTLPEMLKSSKEKLYELLVKIAGQTTERKKTKMHK